MAVYRNREGVVVLLIDDQNRIAMQLRDNKPNLPAANQWGLFGGLSEAGEQPQAVLLREIQEELGVDLEPSKIVLLRKHYIQAQNLTTWVFQYRVTDELEQADLREGQAWDFIAADDSRVDNIGLHHREIALDYWNAANQ